jgi:tetrapyrrole methylase family protein / MazG family protein
MPSITIVGIGPGSTKYLTGEAKEALLAAEKVVFRMGSHPVYHWLKDQRRHVVCFDILYTVPLAGGRATMYELMTDALLKEVEVRGTACYAVPGNPGVLEDTTAQLRMRTAEKGIDLKIVPGMSFLDLIYAELGIDPLGLQIVLPRRHLQSGLFSTRTALLVCQVDPQVTQESLLKQYPPDHRVTLIWTAGLPDYALESKEIDLKQLTAEFTDRLSFASLYVPARPEERSECEQAQNQRC